MTRASAPVWRYLMRTVQSKGPSGTVLPLQTVSVTCIESARSESVVPTVTVFAAVSMAVTYAGTPIAMPMPFRWPMV